MMLRQFQKTWNQRRNEEPNTCFCPNTLTNATTKPSFPVPRPKLVLKIKSIFLESIFSLFLQEPSYVRYSYWLRELLTWGRNRKWSWLISQMSWIANGLLYLEKPLRYIYFLKNHPSTESSEKNSAEHVKGQKN